MKKVAGAKKKEILTAIFGSVEEAEAQLGMVKEVLGKIDRWAESSFFASLIEQVEGGKVTPHWDKEGTLDFFIGEGKPPANKSPDEPYKAPSNPRLSQAFKDSDVRKISLGDLREEAKRLGIDVSHLGRKKTKILELLNKANQDPETTVETAVVQPPKAEANVIKSPKVTKAKPSDDLNFLDDFDNEPVDGGGMSEGFEVVVEEVYIPKSTKFSTSLNLGSTYANKKGKGGLDLRSIRSNAEGIDVDALLEPETEV